MTTQFNSLSQCVSYYHRQLDELLMLHQEALIVQNLDAANAALRIFAKFLKAHLDLEDELLISLHDGLKIEKNWRTLIYQEEHKKLVDLLGNIQNTMSRPPEDEKEELRRWVIELIDYERTFKNVMEHHEEREEKGLLTELDNNLDKGELNRLITRCHLDWQECYDSLREDIEEIREQLP